MINNNDALKKKYICFVTSLLIISVASFSLIGIYMNDLFPVKVPGCISYDENAICLQCNQDLSLVNMTESLS